MSASAMDPSAIVFQAIREIDVVLPASNISGRTPQRTACDLSRDGLDRDISKSEGAAALKPGRHQPCCTKCCIARLTISLQRTKFGIRRRTAATENGSRIRASQRPAERDVRSSRAAAPRGAHQPAFVRQADPTALSTITSISLGTGLLNAGANPSSSLAASMRMASNPRPRAIVEKSTAGSAKSIPTK